MATSKIPSMNFISLAPLSNPNDYVVVPNTASEIMVSTFTNVYASYSGMFLVRDVPTSGRYMRIGGQSGGLTILVKKNNDGTVTVQYIDCTGTDKLVISVSVNIAYR